MVAVGEHETRGHEPLDEYRHPQDERGFLSPIVHGAVEAHMHGNHVGHMHVTHRAHGEGDGHDGQVQQVPFERDGSRHGLLAHHRDRLLRVSRPTALGFVCGHLGAERQHERVAACGHRQRPDDQRAQHAACVAHGGAREADDREHRRSRPDDGGVAALESYDVRIVLLGGGNGDREHLAAAHEVRGDGHERADDRHEQCRNGHYDGRVEPFHYSAPPLNAGSHEAARSMFSPCASRLACAVRASDRSPAP